MTTSLEKQCWEPWEMSGEPSEFQSACWESNGDAEIAKEQEPAEAGGTDGSTPDKGGCPLGPGGDSIFRSEPGGLTPSYPTPGCFCTDQGFGRSR